MSIVCLQRYYIRHCRRKSIYKRLYLGRIQNFVLEHDQTLIYDVFLGEYERVITLYFSIERDNIVIVHYKLLTMDVCTRAISWE